MTRRRTTVVLLAMGALVLGGCTGGAASDQASSSTSGSATGSQSRIDAAVAALDDIAGRAMSKTGVPGMSIAVVHDGKTVYAKGFGLRKAGTTDAVDADTTFQVASVSKPIGASVVAQVVGAEQVSWDDPVARYLPDFRLRDPYVTRNVTVGDLYSMRSGLPGTIGDELELVGYSREQVLVRLRYAPLDPFRATYHYTNFGLTAGAEAVAAATKTPWERLSKERIYDPLGMTRTTSDYRVFLTQDNRATLHTQVDGVWGANETRDPRPQAPAGGVSTSANDMAKWLTMQLAGGAPVIEPAALQESRIPRIASRASTDPAEPSRMSGYGIGIENDPSGRVRYAFSGAFTAGAATNFQLLPAEKLGISVFTNGFPIGVPEAVTSEFLDLVENGESTKDWLTTMAELFAPLAGDPDPPAKPAGAAPPAALSTYTGLYSNAWAGPVAVRTEGSSLVAVAGPAKVAFPLAPYDGNQFTATDPATGQYAGFVTFAVAAGRATSMTMEYFDGQGLGTLRRVGG